MLPPVIDSFGNPLGEWLQARGIVRIEPMGAAPWARVYRVIPASGRPMVLKIISKPRTESFAIAQLLSEAERIHCPHVHEADPTRGLILLEDLAQDAPRQTHQVTRFAPLAAYGGLQGRLAQNASLFARHSIARSTAAAQLAQFWALAEEPSRPDSGNVFHIFAKADADAIMAMLRAHQGLLQQLADVVDAAPATINHTDLNEGNVHLRANGQICLIDWDEAILSAPGWSLHLPFGGVRGVLAAARRAGSASGQAVAAFGLYAKLLSKSGLFTQEALVTLLPAAACFGVMKYAADMAPHTLHDAALRGKVGQFAAQRLFDLGAALDDMARPGQVRVFAASPFTDAPLLPFPEPKPNQQTLTAEVAEAADLFRRNGTVLLRDCIAPHVLHQINTEIENSWADHQAQIAAGKALRVGEGRYMISLSTDGTIGRPDVLAAQKIVALCRSLLGPDMVLGSLTTVVSLPGSPAQQWHSDNSILFPDQPDLLTPPFSIAVIIPTIKLRPDIGATEVRPRSHLPDAAPLGPPPSTIADLNLGDCYLMDSRVMHRGLPNHSNIKRPILSLVYQRPWYRDYQNFNHQETLQIGPRQLAEFSPSDRSMVAWALKKTPA